MSGIEQYLTSDLYSIKRYSTSDLYCSETMSSIEGYSPGPGCWLKRVQLVSEVVIWGSASVVSPVDVDPVRGRVVHTGVTIPSLHQGSPGPGNSPAVIGWKSINQ